MSSEWQQAIVTVIHSLAIWSSKVYACRWAKGLTRPAESYDFHCSQLQSNLSFPIMMINCEIQILTQSATYSDPVTSSHLCSWLNLFLMNVDVNSTFFICFSGSRLTSGSSHLFWVKQFQHCASLSTTSGYVVQTTPNITSFDLMDGLWKRGLTSVPFVA